MKTRYKFFDVAQSGAQYPVLLTLEDIYKLVRDPAKTAEENEHRIKEFITQKKAVRYYDAFFNEYQLETRFLSTGVGREETFGVMCKLLQTQLCLLQELDSQADIQIERQQRLFSILGEILFSAARLADAAGVSLSEIAERNIKSKSTSSN